MVDSFIIILNKIKSYLSYSDCGICYLFISQFCTLRAMQQIGIIRRNGLGDLLCVMPLVYLCQERFPDVEVTLIVDQRGAPLLPYLEGVEGVVMARSFNKYLALGKTAWGLRKRKFDLVISARPTPMKLLNIFLYLLRSERRMAYVDGAWHGKWIDQARVFETDKRHQMVKGLRLLDPSLEEVPDRLKPRLNVKPRYTFEKKSLFVSVTNNREGSILESKRMARILNGIRKDFEVVINCELRHKVEAEELAQKLEMKNQVIATKNFDDFMGLVASVDRFFLGDGGTMHLAAALDKPQVVLFGGTKIWEWAPLSEKAMCLGDPYNVNSIPEGQILESLEKIL